MQRLSKLSVLFAILLLAGNCKIVQYTPTDYPKEQISFGTGGGFSGIVTEYFLLRNGDFFKMTSIEEGFKKGNPVDERRTQQVFSNYYFLGIDDVEFNHPGSAYYFITYKHGENEHQVVWGDGAHAVDTRVKTFYRNLRQLVKSSGFAPVKTPQSR